MISLGMNSKQLAGQKLKKGRKKEFDKITPKYTSRVTSFFRQAIEVCVLQQIQNNYKTHISNVPLKLELNKLNKFKQQETLSRSDSKWKWERTSRLRIETNENALQTEIAAKLHKMKYLYLYKYCYCCDYADMFACMGSYTRLNGVPRKVHAVSHCLDFL